MQNPARDNKYEQFTAPPSSSYREIHESQTRLMIDLRTYERYPDQQMLILEKQDT